MPRLGYPIKKLAGLLEGSDARPVLVPSRLAPSAIYDVEYRGAVIALVFEAFAKPFGGAARRRISTARLKLLQFVTLRPWLLPAIREWSEGLAQGSLDLTHSVRIRRGFLSDTACDDVLALLVSAGILLRDGSQLISGQAAAYFTEVARSVTENNLFSDERRVISQLTQLLITNNMLEGW